jgi:hypothetical protein
MSHEVGMIAINTEVEGIRSAVRWPSSGVLATVVVLTRWRILDTLHSTRGS